jgi:TRAP-type C4-dicarboxylate transport system permease small subunit
MHMTRVLEKLADIWGIIERYAAGLVMIVMTALYGFNVLVRFLAPSYASQFAWIDEAARLLMVWVVFLALGLALEVGRHVSVDMLHARLSHGRKRALFALIDVVGLVFSAGAAVLALQLTLLVMQTGQFSPTLGTPVYFLYVAPAIGFTSLAFRYLLRLLAIRDSRRQTIAPDWLEDSEG